jgi:carbon-monoxide dehydrogenase medium subunit
MDIPKIDYIRPRTIDEVCTLLHQYKDRGKIIAGGTDLLTRMKKREITPEILIDIKAIPGLDKIVFDKDQGLTIGALTTVQALEDSALIKERFAVLHKAVSQLGSVQVRHMGTIGGNLCNAAPSAETAPALIGLGAKAKISGKRGEATVRLEDFFIGPGKTVLKEDEILVELLIPNPLPRTAGVYIKHTLRRAMDIAMVGIAVVVSLDLEGRAFREVIIVLGAVAPIPMRAKQAEAIIRGNPMRVELAERASEMASREARPISDIRASAEYRKEMVKVLTFDAIQRVWELARAMPGE